MLQHLDRSEVTEVVVNGDDLQFTLSAGQIKKTVMPANYVKGKALFVYFSFSDAEEPAAGGPFSSVRWRRLLHHIH